MREKSTPTSVPQRPDRDPELAPAVVLRPADGRILDPRQAASVRDVGPRPTAYIGPRLLVSGLVDVDAVVQRLEAAAEDLGWTVELEDAGAPSCQCDDGALALRCVRIEVGPGRCAGAPDGWVLLQEARATYGVAELYGVMLDHVLSLTPTSMVSTPQWSSNPQWSSSPQWSSDPQWSANPGSHALASYSLAGSGGRQPVAYIGPRPPRRPDHEIEGRRPVVAVLDTGCGSHPWLDDVVRRDVRLDGERIGAVDRATDPEVHHDQDGPLDGGLDTHAGHGTFIAGLVHQTCPDADILSFRVVSSSGVIVESEWLRALSQVAELARRHVAGEPDGHPIDVVNISMGYYHETPEDPMFDRTLRKVLDVLGECGVVVVCSVGNDATARPFYPAALAPDAEGDPPSRDRVPVVSVGALNPNGGTVALFSNTGGWVRTYATGAAVLSTTPQMQGGRMPMSRAEALGYLRESIDPDDFASGFALWSGTSFATPLIAGRFAAHLADGLPERERRASDAVGRAWTAITELTDIR